MDFHVLGPECITGDISEGSGLLIAHIAAISSIFLVNAQEFSLEIICEEYKYEFLA